MNQEHREELINDIETELADMQRGKNEILEAARSLYSRYRHIKALDAADAIVTLEEAIEEGLHEAYSSLRNRALELDYDLPELTPSIEKVKWLVAFEKRQILTNPATKSFTTVRCGDSVQFIQGA